MPTEEDDTFPTDALDEVRGFTSVGDANIHQPLERLEAIHEKLSSKFETVEDRDESSLTEKESTLLVEYVTFSAAVLEQHSAMLLHLNLKNQEETNRYISVDDFFVDDLNQYQRIELLYHMGIIDDGLKGEMDKVRKLRNRIVHYPYERVYFRPDGDDQTLQADIDRALRAVRKLHELE